MNAPNKEQFPGKEHPDDVLAAYERTLGLGICIKIFHTRSTTATQIHQIGSRFGLHLSAFCRGVKREQNLACCNCDLGLVPERCRREREMFVHECHGGGCELIVPVLWEGEVALVVYLGQFRRSARGPRLLPLLSSARQREIRLLAVGLQSYLVSLLEARIQTGKKEEGSRRAEIEEYLAHHLEQSPSLEMLARAVGLSPSRCAHVVKEVCNCSFTELRDRLRLARAQNLLMSGRGKIAAIAEACGFGDTHYFHRFFRNKTGMTPVQFRAFHLGRKSA